MKLTANQLRQIIKEEVQKVVGEGVHSLKVAKAVSDFTSNPRKWSMARNDIASMAMGGDGDGIRDQYYSGWTDDEFRQLWTEMGQDPSELE